MKKMDLSMILLVIFVHDALIISTVWDFVNKQAAMGIVGFVGWILSFVLLVKLLASRKKDEAKESKEDETSTGDAEK